MFNYLAYVALRSHQRKTLPEEAARHAGQARSPRQPAGISATRRSPLRSLPGCLLPGQDGARAEPRRAITAAGGCSGVPWAWVNRTRPVPVYRAAAMDVQAPPRRHPRCGPDQPPTADPGMIPLAIPRDHPPARPAISRAARPRRALSDLAAPPPGVFTLVPPARPARPGQLAKPLPSQRPDVAAWPVWAASGSPPTSKPMRVRFGFGEVVGCAGGHARGRRLRRGVRRPTGATAGSAMNGCRRRLR